MSTPKKGVPVLDGRSKEKKDMTPAELAELKRIILRSAGNLCLELGRNVMNANPGVFNKVH